MPQQPPYQEHAYELAPCEACGHLVGSHHRTCEACGAHNPAFVPLDEELHLSTLGGLHVIDTAQRRPGDVMQSAVTGVWERPGVFLLDTGERLHVAKDGTATWGDNG